MCASAGRCFPFFFFNVPPPTRIYTLSLHDALPISGVPVRGGTSGPSRKYSATVNAITAAMASQRAMRSEEHTSELQPLTNLVCRLLLEKKKTKRTPSQNSSTSAKETNITVHTSEEQ